MDRYLAWLMVASLLLATIALFKRNNHYPPATWPEAIHVSPEQTSLEEDRFSTEQGGVTYEVEPLYRYRLVGRVVSFRHHDGNYGLHRLWNDHLNVADLCVVWSENATAVDLDAFAFWNGQFTCNWTTGNQVAWDAFDETAISNNHLITNRPWLRRAIADVQVGDVVQLQGRLANYRGPGQVQPRTSSTVRTDTGDGACEVLWVDDFRVLAEMPNPWRRVWTGSSLTFVISLALWLFLVVSGRAKFRAR